MNKIKVAVFASGAGSNAEKLIQYFNQANRVAEVALIACNKRGAGVLAIAEQNNVPAIIIEKEIFFNGDAYVATLQKMHISYIVLAGFLWKIPSRLIEAYSEKIINLHPALLPKYGGKGMYGSFVHQAVLQAGDTQSGITIHVVDELYDHGKHIAQIACDVLPNDTVETLAARIHALEHQNFPSVVEQYILSKESK